MFAKRLSLNHPDFNCSAGQSRRTYTTFGELTALGIPPILTMDRVLVARPNFNWLRLRSRFHFLCFSRRDSPKAADIVRIVV